MRNKKERKGAETWKIEERRGMWGKRERTEMKYSGRCNEEKWRKHAKPSELFQTYLSQGEEEKYEERKKRNWDEGEEEGDSEKGGKGREGEGVRASESQYLLSELMEFWQVTNKCSLSLPSQTFQRAKTV